MIRAFAASVLVLVAFAVPVKAQVQHLISPEPPFIALTVALVDQNVTGGRSAVIVWGPHENGTNHVILLPQGHANAGELRKAVTTLVALVKNGASFRTGTFLRAEFPKSEIDGSPHSLEWVPREIIRLKDTEAGALAGFGVVPYILTVFEVD